MAISGIASSGLISGLNVSEIVSSIIQQEARPMQLLETRQNDYRLQIASVLSLSSKLSSYKSTMESLNNVEKFNTKSASITTTSNNVELATVSTDNTAANGTYSIDINQLAASHKLASQGWLDKNSTVVASSSGSLKFKIGSDGAETSIGVTTSMTLEGLMDKINDADAGVTATIVDDGTGSTPYRLIMTADNSGSANAITITQNDTSLDFTNKKVEAGYAYTTNTYSGTFASNDGNNYTGTTNKTVMMQVVTGGASATATYKYSVDGGINWLGYGGAAFSSSATADTSGGAITTSTSLKAIDGNASTNEGVTASFTAGSDLVVNDKFTIDVFNPQMQAAQDAVIEIDNATIVKSSNVITDSIQGITINLLKADSTENLTLTVSSSSASAKSAIEEFVSAYNELFSFVEEQLSFDPDEEIANPLLGDPTLLEIKRKITNTVSGVIPGLPSNSYTNLSQIGITTDYLTGELKLDSSVLSGALGTNPEAVSKLFVGTGTPTNTSIRYEGKTSSTEGGTYNMTISVAPEQATLSGDNDLSSTGLGSEETLIFKFSDNYTDTNASFTSTSVTLSAGSKINTIVNDINSKFATQGLALTASNSSGKLKITSDNYGEDIHLQITSDQGAASDQVFDTSGSYTDQGVDIAGTINNHVASADGNILTGTAGFPEAGLQVSTTSNQTGLFGSITVSLGMADRLPSILDSYVNLETGILKNKEDSLQSSVDDLKNRIDIMGGRLQDQEQRLLREFTRLESTLAQYDSLANFMATALSSLPKIGR
ncbi:MAG: flagellar filament capping protein FliD [Nitrospira sp.]|nr:flagellar filament capping protein FliD [Nitrospira sp.]